MIDETPVTLDDLPAIDWPDVTLNNFLTSCPRCESVVYHADGALRAHERWHAAIEDLTVTIRTEIPTDFFDNSPPTITAKGSHMLRIPFTLEQRRELVVALGLDPNRAADCTWPAIMDRVREQLAELAEQAERRHTAATGTGASAQTEQVAAHNQPLRTQLIKQLANTSIDNPAAWVDLLMPVIEQATRRPDLDMGHVDRNLAAALQVDPRETSLAQMVELVEHIMYANGRCKIEHAGLSKGETDRLRRVEQALIDVGAPARSERGDPGGLQVAWIRRQAERMRQQGQELAARRAEAGPVEQVCPSLYLYNGTLFPCNLAIELHAYNGNDGNGDEYHAYLVDSPDGDAMKYRWQDKDAVPSPWPIDREPPAGIDILRDTADGMYLCRETDGWEWWKYLADRTDVDGETREWPTAVLDVDGDLIVVRP